jgi:Ca-activated chloride channel homolog
MSFMWPQLLWLAGLLPLLVLGYFWLLSRRKRQALGFSSLSLVRQALGSGPSWRRHVPPVLALLGFTFLVLAMSRPTAVVTLPTDHQTVMLVMDVSGSMKATDVAPDRISASQEAAKVFVNELPRGMRVGVVAYGGTAHLVQSPTTNREDVLTAIDRFQLQPGTAIGSGIVVALATLFPQAGIDLSQLNRPRSMGPPRLSELGLPQDDPAGGAAPGSYQSAAIVVLTDGSNTTGLNPMDAAQVAASRGVKIFTVGFGTRDGVTIDFNGWSMRVRLDEDTLKNISNITQGQYFHASGGTDLKAVYQALRSRLLLERRETEVTALFTMLGSLLVLMATALSVWWYGRVA